MTYSNLNRWQKAYCNEYYKGKLPTSRQGKYDLELLSKVDKTITVTLRDGETKTFKVTEHYCDIPNGLISVPVLVSNLNLWVSRGLNISYEDKTNYQLFLRECDEWSHEYTSAAITNSTLEEVVKVAKEYAEKQAYHDFEGCFYNGREENGIVAFTAYREHPSDIADFFSEKLPDSVVYADQSWDYHEVYIKKNGKDYHGFTAKWDEQYPYPEGYTEDEEDEVYYDCFLLIKDDDTGYEFPIGGGMCSESEFEKFENLVSNHSAHRGTVFTQ